ncbi:hypothetical protein [Pseudomonas juntendi]|uniref:hypothetical protein n=1 Tax=Pseudomonas juntendi TaxID=2666183 RepID=UPI0018D5DF41|nr:hypothetical protein [Pseudomonas juntendi]MBH3373109.1 hypothetical protein [Pseudomonas juntendi]
MAGSWCGRWGGGGGRPAPPPATGATGTVDWSAVAYMLTAVYMGLQIVLLVPKYRQMLRDWKVRP